MQTAADYIDQIRDRYALSSDRQAAALIGVSSPSVTRFRSGEDSFSDSTARRVAALLELDPVTVAFDAHAQRAKTADDRALWERAAANYRAAQDAGMCIMSTSRHPRRRWSDFLDASPAVPPAFMLREHIAAAAL